jgi:hypothetical protein
VVRLTRFGYSKAFVLVRGIIIALKSKKIILKINEMQIKIDDA